MTQKMKKLIVLSRLTAFILQGYFKHILARQEPYSCLQALPVLGYAQFSLKSANKNTNKTQIDWCLVPL
jgi:hypothetical protein